jgi:hypothetical protein
MKKSANDPMSALRSDAGGSSPAVRPSFMSVALRLSVVRRALGYAVFVGAILIAINHGDSLLSGDLSGGQLIKMLLTACVPYCVSTASSVGAIRSATD